MNPYRVSSAPKPPNDYEKRVRTLETQHADILRKLASLDGRAGTAEQSIDGLRSHFTSAV